MAEQKTPKVFISYSHVDAEYEAKMFEFANRLREDGIDANIDLYEDAPKEGWQRWMEKEISKSDYVLIVCSISYWEKFYNNHAKGISWEVNLIYQLFYDTSCKNSKFIPVFWNNGDEQYILTPLKSSTYYNIGTENGYQNLWRRLLGIQKYKKPELGKINKHKYDALPAKPKRSMFFTTPIDVDKWNKAGWCAMMYLMYPVSDKPPILGFVYKDFEAAKSIFKQWQKDYSILSVDDYLQLTFVIPPYPKNCYVYENVNSNFGKGYFVHVGANIEKAMERAQEIIKQDNNDIMLTVVSRFIWMNEVNGNNNRVMFRNIVEKIHHFLIVPVSLKDPAKGFKQDNLHIGFEYALDLHNVNFKKGTDLDEKDECRIVLEERKI